MIDIEYNIIAIFSPLITFYLLKVFNFRAERVVSEFYFALQENYPRSYVKQTKLIKLVRKFCGMSVDEKIHWMHCFGIYLQIIGFVLQTIILFYHLPFAVDGGAFIILRFCIRLICFCGVLIVIFTLLLIFMCKKIKIDNPKYSKCELKYWSS